MAWEAVWEVRDGDFCRTNFHREFDHLTASMSKCGEIADFRTCSVISLYADVSYTWECDYYLDEVHILDGHVLFFGRCEVFSLIPHTYKESGYEYLVQKISAVRWRTAEIKSHVR